MKDRLPYTFNGIFNDQERAMALAYQNSGLAQHISDKDQVFYAVVIEPANNWISEMLGVAYEKLVPSADYGLASFLGYTNGATLLADLLRSRGDEATTSLGHSRGTLVQEAAFTILANEKDVSGKTYTNPNLTVRGVGGAANAEAYSEKAAKLLGAGGDKSQITFNYFSNDPVSTSTFSGGNPGAWKLSDLWQVINTTNSMHSCYGTGAVGCTQVEMPVPGGPQGTQEGNAKLIEFVGGQRKAAPSGPSLEGK